MPRMDQVNSCVLCLSVDQKCFLEVCCENDDDPNKTLIIAKHLRFDLKLTQQSQICVQCWKSVYDFHLFYCKVQTIHSEELGDLEAASRVALVSQHSKDGGDYEYDRFSEDIVKAEPLELHQDGEDDGIEDTECNVKNNSHTDRTVERPRRRVKPPDRFKSDPSNLMRYEGKLPFLEVNVIGPNDDDDDEASVGADQLDDMNSNTDTETIIVPPKKRRGRQPKQKPAEEGNPTPNDAATADITLDDVSTGTTNVVPAKKRRGRPPKQKSDERVTHTRLVRSKTRPRKSINSMTSESEQDEGSDFETSYNGKRLKRKANSSGKLPSQKNIISPHDRDEKIYAYIDEFVCEYCPEKVIFDRFSEATRHYRDVHMERAFLKCPKCDKKTYTSGEFASHVETHSNPERCKCTVCGKMTPSKVALNKHMRCHQIDLEGNYPFPCRMCSRRFEVEDKRDKHELLHRPKPIIPKQYGRDEAMLEFYKQIYCDLCEETTSKSITFDNFWDLKVHMNKQHDKPPYLKCPICLKKMGVRHQIMMHIDVHKNPELYRCEVCSEVHQYLDRHMIAAHTPSTTAPEKKRYNCEQCGKIFRFRWKLKYHINEAHGLKDVSCDICKKFFTRPALAAHKRKAHVEGQATFLCDHCPKLFHKQQSLRMHIAFAHENRRKHKKCNICGKEVSGLSKHMQMVHPPDGPTTCDLCGKKFRSSFHMKRHRVNTCAATINSRPYKCEVCGKGFSLKLTMTEHMTTHTRTNLYQCAFCLKTYGYLSNLQKHRKKAHPVEWQQVQGDQSIVTVIPLNAPVPVTTNENEFPVTESENVLLQEHV